jgi:hypothetical protein
MPAPASTQPVSGRRRIFIPVPRSSRNQSFFANKCNRYSGLRYEINIFLASAGFPRCTDFIRLQLNLWIGASHYFRTVSAAQYGSHVAPEQVNDSFLSACTGHWPEQVSGIE